MLVTHLKTQSAKVKSLQAGKEERLQQAQQISLMSHFNWFAKYEHTSVKKKAG